jgi:hypothetical protein
VFDADPPGFKYLSERMRIDDTSDLFPENMKIHFADVEIHVFRVPDASMKKTEVAPPLHHERSFIYTPAELGEE